MANSESFKFKRFKAYRQGSLEELSSAIISIKKEFYDLKKINSTLLLCINTLYDSNDSENAINYLLATIAGYYKADRAYIFEFSEDKQTLSNTFEWCAENIAAEIDSLQNIEMNVINRWLELFEKKGEVNINNIHKEINPGTTEYAILEIQGIESLMAVPFYERGQVVGFIGVDNPKENDDSMVLMKSVATFIVSDLQRRNYIKQLYELSYFDKMTGLQNRQAYIKKLEEYESKIDKDIKIGILFADINGLKAANDTFGHKKGDEMIVEAAKILKTIKDKDAFGIEFDNISIFRIGGDEFVVFCEKLSEKAFYKKVSELKKYSIISVGAVWLTKCENIEKHVTEADALMYKEKVKYHRERR